MIFTKSTGHATTSCAKPPAHPAQNTCILEGFSGPGDNRRRVLAYTPKKRALRVPVASRGNPIPL